MRERSGRIAEAWYAVCRTQDLRPARPVGRTVMEEMLVLWRDGRGRPRAMKDRCLHRNALLSEGKVFDGCIGCPYHGWTYDAEGWLISVPSEGEEGGRPSDARRLETFSAVEKDGLVWVWLGRGTPQGAPFDMPHYHEPGWRTYYMVTRFSNGVTHLVENFMDVPHTVFVHRGWFRRRKRQRIPTLVERTEHSVLVTYEQPKDAIGFTERILNPQGQGMVHTDRFYMPNVTRVDYLFGNRGFVITSTCTPITDYETEVFTLISFRLGHPVLNYLGLLALPPYTRKVIQQDVEIMANQGRSLRHHGGAQFSSTSADIIHEHIEALRDYAEGGHSGCPPPPRKDRMEFWI